MKPPKRVETFFRCPECGGDRWGTSGCTGPRKEMRGHCNNLACRFSWPRSEDWRVFMVTIKPTRAEYKRYEALRLRLANRDLKKNPPKMKWVSPSYLDMVKKARSERASRRDGGPQ